MWDLSKQKVLVIGGGLSGTAAARLLHTLGAKVTIVDAKSKLELKDSRLSLTKVPVKWIYGEDLPPSSKDFSLIVISPGVPRDHPLVKGAHLARVPVIGELELAYRFQNLKILAVTGSNGKTTVAQLTYHILKKLGIPAYLAGNIGEPFSDCVRELLSPQPPNYEVAVLEVSSFQLETIREFHAKGAAFLNLSPDHLDRHKDMGSYLGVKNRVFLNQGPEDFAIINIDDPLLAIKTHKAKIFGFSSKIRPEFGGYVDPNETSPVFRIVEGSEILATNPYLRYRLWGAHNQENILAAVGLSLSVGADPQKALEALEDFTPASHRLELVGTFQGVTYVDDSKGTNVGAVLTALSNFPQKSVILIAGGRDKDMDFRPLKIPAREKVRHLILMGEARHKLKNVLKGTASMTSVSSMFEAVKVAKNLAKPGETVLLSPGCASYDMFKSYKERGEIFQNEVRLQNTSPQPKEVH